MANPKSFPLVRGRVMRVTKVDLCCAPDYGADNMVVTDGFVSIALTANINEPEELVVTNANGQTCVRDPGCPEFQGYNVEITFCNVTPCLFSLVTGQPVVLDADGEVVGFRMNSKIRVCDQGFALEVWMGVPGVACGEEAAAGAFGYLLLPCLQAGVVGDFTIENAAVTFSVTGAVTRGGNAWGVGPYDDVVAGETPGSTAALPNPLDPDDHLYAIFTTAAPPELTDGCADLVPAGGALSTGATEVSGAAGTWTPASSIPPDNFQEIGGITASPLTAWTTGSHVVLGDATHAHWDATEWVEGDAP